MNLEKEDFVLKGGNIEVDDYLIPEFNSQPFIIIHSFWHEKKRSGVCFAEIIDPRSWFYPIKKCYVKLFNDVKLLEEYHKSLADTLDWRNKKKKGDK